MGRLFQYNRFGQEAVDNKKDITTHRSSARTNESSPVKNSLRTNNKYKALACPGYSELYPEYKQPTAVRPTTIPTTTMPTKSTEQEMTTSTFMSSSTTLKSVELAIKKYQQWSNKFLTNSQATAEQPTSVTTTTTSEDNRQSSTSTSLSSSSAASSTSGYHSQQQCRESDTGFLMTTTQKKPKVYDCMKGFLKRKLFHQTVETTLKVTQEEEATSDYDELEVLDSSYNADEEYETDTSSTCSCPNADDESDTDAVGQVPKLPSALKLICWPNHTTLSDATSTSSITSDEEEEEQEDTDAGISDCCQLLTERSPKRRSLMKRKNKLSTPKPFFNKVEDNDLLDAIWYQPHLSNKAATERLQHEAPGAFVLRRKTHCFELLVRLETKVKNYSLLDCGKSFKFKEATKEFSSLRALVTHHSVMAEHLPLTLTLPRPKEQEQCKQSPRYTDDFDSFESLQILGILKRLQAENLEFS